MRSIEMTFSKRKFNEPEPVVKSISGVDGLRLLEELRRMLIPITGDPDVPMQKVVFKRRFDVRS